MKHFILILLIISIILAGIFLPYIPGDYDYFAVGLSYIFQFVGFTSLLLVPIGAICWMMNFTNQRKNYQTAIYPAYLFKIAFVVTLIIIIAAALGALASNNRFSAIIIFCTGIYILLTSHKKIKILFDRYTTPYYFILIPLTVVFVHLTVLEKVKNYTTNFVIKQCELLIQDIESYKRANGHYPVSLLSTIEDYKPQISGIPRFYYERKGNAYNIYFQQLSNMLGTDEIVMYNKLDEQEMTVHNQDLLRIPYANIIHGHHKTVQMPGAHWKIFYFD